MAKRALRRVPAGDGVGWGLPRAGEPTVERRGSPVAVRVLIADAAATPADPFWCWRVSRGSRSRRSEQPFAAGAEPCQRISASLTRRIARYWGLFKQPDKQEGRYAGLNENFILVATSRITG